VIHEQSQWFERLAYLFTAVAAFSLSQAAYILTIVSTLIAIVLGGIKIHDRLKYGPARGRE
jgi:methyl coenzyme M reductase subunit D